MAATAAVLLVTGLTGCDDETPEATAQVTPTVTLSAEPSATPSAPVTPSGPVLTTPGSTLRFGESAKVATTGKKREGALKLTVTGLHRAKWSLFEGWKVGKRLRKHQPIFVDVKVRNIGAVNLGGAEVPLHLLDVQDRLIEASTFADTFKSCPSTPLPKPFKKDAQVTRCLVFLVPDGAEVTAVVHRSSAEADLVRWTGPTTPWKQPGKKNTGKKGSDKVAATKE